MGFALHYRIWSPRPHLCLACSHGIIVITHVSGCRPSLGIGRCGMIGSGKSYARADAATVFVLQFSCRWALPAAK